ncbi:MAG: hypothetical protein HUK17_03410 [Bacteroidales bacterium]|nr:hypothetical protein [Bacteroidales bacterium]
MKKLHLIALVALLSLAATSCKKDIDDLGTFSEGIYQPSFRIASIQQNGSPLETWNWGSAKLSSISLPQEGATLAFSYNGDQIGSVVITKPGTDMQTISYSYGGSKLTKVEVVNGTRTDISMQINHNADDKISNVRLDFSDQYLVDLAFGMLGSLKTLGSLIGDQNARSIAQAAKSLCPKSNPEKYSISNKSFTMTYVWNDDDDLTQTVLSGNVTATATLADVGNFIDLGALQSILSMIGSDIEFPLSVTVNQTTNYTYDDKNNPFYCLYRNTIDASNLSKHNLLNAVASGAADMSLTLTIPSDIPIMGGMTYPLNRAIDLSGSDTYTYTYNKKNLPETYTLNGSSFSIIYE